MCYLQVIRSLTHTHSPTAAELLQNPFFRYAKKKSCLVGTILDGLPPLAMRQERCRHPENLTTQRTVDSWDFGSTTTTSSQGSSLIRPSSMIAQQTTTLSITSEHDDDDEPETSGCLSQDNSAEPSAMTSSLKSGAMSPPHATTPISIAHRHGISVHQHSPPSPYSSAVTPPSPSLWDKLTRRPRNVLADEEPPKSNSFSRLLNKRGSSLTQHPAFTST